jgi:hypothetical protein
LCGSPAETYWGKSRAAINIGQRPAVPPAEIISEPPHPQRGRLLLIKPEIPHPTSGNLANICPFRFFQITIQYPNVWVYLYGFLKTQFYQHQQISESTLLNLL